MVAISFLIMMVLAAALFSGPAMDQYFRSRWNRISFLAEARENGWDG